jgi:hypothetical protein
VNRIGSLSKWVDNNIFFCIPCHHLPAYNTQCQSWHQTVMDNHGQIHKGSHLWFRGDTIPDGRPEEFNEDMAFPCAALLIHVLMHSSPMQMQMLTTYLTSLEFHGNHTKWYHSVMLSHSSVLCGTSQLVQLKYPQRINTNTPRLLRNGRRSHVTPWLKYRNSMENYYTLPWSYQLDKCTSQTWRPCSVRSMIALSCHTPHPVICLTTSGGGPTFSTTQSYPDPSQVLHSSKIFTPSQMQAPVLALVSVLAKDGMLGVYSQAGKQRDKTLVGQRLSASSSMYTLSCHPAPAILTSESLWGQQRNGQGMVERSEQKQADKLFFFWFLEIYMQQVV